MAETGNVGRPGVTVVYGTDNNERSLRELLMELWHNSQHLLRQEKELAITELDQKLGKAKTDAIALGIAATVLNAAVLALVAALILALDEIMAAWVAALIVGIALAGVGYALLKKAQTDVKEGKLAPKRTAHSLNRDVQVFKEAYK